MLKYNKNVERVPTRRPFGGEKNGRLTSARLSMPLRSGIQKKDTRTGADAFYRRSSGYEESYTEESIDNTSAL